MDCTICLEGNLSTNDFVYLECGHKICKECFLKLIRNTCPYCREVIKYKEDNVTDLNNDITLTEDLIITIINA